MKLFIVLSLLLIEACFSSTPTLCYEDDTEISRNTSVDCKTSPLSTLLQKHYRGHPYKNVNINKETSAFDPYSLKFKIGDAGNYILEGDGNPQNKGGFGKVFKAIDKRTNQTHALKVIDSKTSDILKEIKFLNELKDAPNFLPVKEILIDQKRFGQPFTLVFDHFNFTHVQDLIKKIDKFALKKMMYEALRTLDYIHSKGIMHRDLKHWNILMNPETLEVRMIDFGVSEYYFPGKEIPHSVGTIHYKAPELFLAYDLYDYSIDIWSLGTIFGEMMFRRYYLFKTKREEDFTNVDEKRQRYVRNRNQLDAIASVMGTVDLLQYSNKFRDSMRLRYLKYVDDHKKMPWTSMINKKNKDLVDASGLDLLSKLLVVDHTKRITAKEALNHQYFDDIRPHP